MTGNGKNPINRVCNKTALRMGNLEVRKKAFLKETWSSARESIASPLFTASTSYERNIDSLIGRPIFLFTGVDQQLRPTCRHDPPAVSNDWNWYPSG